MISKLKSLVRQLFYRSSLFRGIVGTASILLGRTQATGMSHLLSYRENDAIGPLQRDEAIALFGIVRTLRPKTLVEFGFFHGHSAFNFLQAMTDDARLFSYDIDGDSIRRARTEFTFDRRFTFIGKSQTEFAPGDIGNREIDFVFFDAAHELELNIETFNRIAPHLAAEAMVAVHDTGLWNRSHFAPIHETFTREYPGVWKSGDLYAHQPGERAFIEWVLENHPEFTAIHFHSTNTLRHGFSLLQRKRNLTD
ncbi:MAG: class I SAM-dependent methyltransferase [Verrucomicrobiota bacterium]